MTIYSVVGAWRVKNFKLKKARALKPQNSDIRASVAFAGFFEIQLDVIFRTGQIIIVHLIEQLKFIGYHDKVALKIETWVNLLR